MRGNSETFPTFSLTQHFSVSFFFFLFRNCKRARPQKYHLKKANWIGKTFWFSSSFPTAIFLLEIQITGNFSSTSERQDRFRTRNRFRVGIFTCFTFFSFSTVMTLTKLFLPLPWCRGNPFGPRKNLNWPSLAIHSFLFTLERKKKHSSVKTLRRFLILSRKNSHSHTQAPQAAWPPHEDTSPLPRTTPRKLLRTHTHTNTHEHATMQPRHHQSLAPPEQKWNGAPQCGVLFFPWKSAANWVSVPSDGWGKGPRLRRSFVRSHAVCTMLRERGWFGDWPHGGATERGREN